MFIEQDIQKGYVPFPAARAQLYRDKGYWGNQTHFQLLKQAHLHYGNNIAVIQNSEQLSYSDLYHYAVHYGTWLKHKGIQETDFILVQSANVIEFFVAIFALYYIGARPVFCLNGHGSYEIENIARQSRATGYIRLVDTPLQKDAENICEEFSEPNFNLWFRHTLTSKENLKTSFSFLAQIEPNPEILSLAHAEDIAFLQLSGGTTGLPKLIARTHTDYIYSIKQSAEASQLTAQTKQLIVLPVMHNFAMSSPGFMGIFYVGGTVILSQNSTPGYCFELIEKHRIQQVSLVPTIATLWLNSERREDFDLSSLSVIQVGGAKLLPTLAQQIIETFHVKLQQVYGMAEGLVNFTQLDDSDEITIQTQGKKLSELDEILIVDHEGNMLDHYQAGLIFTRGPYTINGYYNLPEINSRSFTPEGFYKTGDIGYLDEYNNIVVTGREKEQINRSGEKITPSEVEEFILNHPLVKDVCVLGVSDNYLGERIKAMIIPKEKESEINLKIIRKFLMSKNIAQYKIPDEVEIVTDFKYTHVGKVNRHKLG